MALQFTTSYLEDSLSIFRYYKKLADGAIAQITDEQLHTTLDDEMNSIAIIIKHMTGNMRSRFTDFLTSDGEKPDRDRDREFIDPPQTRADILEMWESGWKCLFATLTSLTDADMNKSITIRGEAHTVMQAINRQIAHYAYHCGQIAFFAKHLQYSHWQSLSVPRGMSADFNSRVATGKASQR